MSREGVKDFKGGCVIHRGRAAGLLPRRHVPRSAYSQSATCAWCTAASRGSAARKGLGAARAAVAFSSSPAGIFASDACMSLSNRRHLSSSSYKNDGRRVSPQTNKSRSLVS